MIPSPPQAKPSAFYDTECFVNYWTLKIRVQSGPLFSFSLLSGESFSEDQKRRICEIFDLFTVISFNGNYYDVPMIAAALAGFNAEQLKWLSDEIIKNNKKPWELNLPIEWKPVDHIDIMNVLPGDGSQKQYAGRIHCKRMQDLPFEPDRWLTEADILLLDSYCENDLSVLESLFVALEPQRTMRDMLTAKWGIDLRSKSDAQMAEAVIKLRCEEAIGQRIYKPEIDWNIRFRYVPPDWIAFTSPQLQTAFTTIKDAIFSLGASGMVEMPPQLKGLQIPLGQAVYTMGIGGLHSNEKCTVYVADGDYCLRDNDVASYYPNLILMSGKFPPALGPVFLEVLRIMKDERLTAKDKERLLKELGDTNSIEFNLVHCENEGGKVMINGTFGKTGSPFSILFAPEMMIQTTITGQLALLMLIEWHEAYGIQVVSANTDGIVIRCRRDQVHISEALIAEWQKRSGLEMETTQYLSIYSRDVNNYFAVKEKFDKVSKQWTGKPDGVKRKGEYSKAGLIEKKNPDVEICSDAVADFLEKQTPILYSLGMSRDIRKFVTVQKVTGGGVKMWGHGPSTKMVRDMLPMLEANGWRKSGRQWARGLQTLNSREAYQACFQPQKPEYLGKVIRWYYGVNSPGPIVYSNSGNMVGLSYGAQPCMELPDEFPGDIDYAWYVNNCNRILKDVGYVAA